MARPRLQQSGGRALEIAITRSSARDWVRSLLGELADGSFPGLEQWRKWRTSGRVPPELTDLAERGADPADPDDPTGEES